MLMRNIVVLILPSFDVLESRNQALMRLSYECYVPIPQQAFIEDIQLIPRR
ncbi:hypothetical protein D3C78_1573840 [compost metagenome]